MTTEKPLNSEERVRQSWLPYRLRKKWQTGRRKAIAGVLNPLLGGQAKNSETCYLTHDEISRLEQKYPPGANYDYTDQAKASRASTRLAKIQRSVPLDRIKTMVELGAGDGQLAKRIAETGVHTSIVDIEDWRDPDVRSSSVTFRTAEVGKPLPLDDQSVDLVVSFNTMEHVADPGETMRELLRALRPGGWLCLEFGPLFNSPLGLHAYRTIGIPYIQFLISTEQMDDYIASRGIHDLGRDREEFQFVNRWSFASWHDLLNQVQPELNQVTVRQGRLEDHLGVVFRHLKCFRGKQLTYDELTTSSLTIVAQKKS